MSLNPQSTAIQSNEIKLQAALNLHQQGELAQAESLYKEILESQPQHFDALQLLATLALQQDKPIAALELFFLRLNNCNSFSLFWKQVKYLPNSSLMSYLTYAPFLPVPSVFFIQAIFIVCSILLPLRKENPQL